MRPPIPRCISAIDADADAEDDDDVCCSTDELSEVETPSVDDLTE